MPQFAVTSRPGRTWKAPRRVTTALIAAAMALSPAIATAQGGGAPIVRDAETEALIRDYTRPLFKAAGVSANSIKIFLVPDQRFNAFVAGNQRMFINVGTIIESETPNEVIGVLAHEIGHVAANDLAQLRQVVNETKAIALVAALLGMGAAVGGSLAGSQSAATIGSGLVAGVAPFAARGVLRYQRVQEAAADQSAISYLNATGQSAAGMVTTLKRLADQSLFSSRNADPYLQSHPLPGERVSTVENLAKQSKYYARTDSAELQARHDLIRGKLIGFTWTPQQVGRRYPTSDNSLPARYARAITAYRSGQIKSALRQIDDLIAANPRYPYFWELKGQVLLETGNPQAAIEPLRKAVSLDSNSGILKVLLGQALVATDNKGNAGEAIKMLSVGLRDDPDSIAGYRSLGRAYAMQDNIPMAQLATAQGLFAEGNFKDAKEQAGRAQAKLKTGSPAWLRADDIVSYNPPKLK
jgi:predicted Zn-dependent protease